MTPCRSETRAYVGNQTVFINDMFANLHQSEGDCSQSELDWLFEDRLPSHSATCIVILRLKVVAQRLHAQLLDDKLALLLVTRRLLTLMWLEP